MERKEEKEMLLWFLEVGFEFYEAGGEVEEWRMVVSWRYKHGRGPSQATVLRHPPPAVAYRSPVHYYKGTLHKHVVCRLTHASPILV